jgi:hypothetical protein
MLQAARPLATYRRLRTEPHWRLMAGQKSPAVIALLQTLLLQSDAVLPASVFLERLTEELEDLRDRGEDLPQSAQAYAADWLSEGYLVRRFPPGSSEESYELSAPAAAAIRFIAGLEAPRAAATQSRLAVVMQQIVSLAEETEPDTARRLESLIAERDRIDRQIENVRAGRIEVLPEPAAIERIREIIGLADDLSADFIRVRERFETLHRELRERVLEDETSRGDVLESLFAGVDLIGASPEGLSFSAFWRLLTDPEQSATLELAIDRVLSRGFVRQLASAERRFLIGLTRVLLAEGGGVHDVLRQFASSLKHFVQSREYLQQRQINKLLNQAQRNALSIKENIPSGDRLDFHLWLTSSRISSLDQWNLFDPHAGALPEPMSDAAEPAIGMESVSELVAQSEIDFETLRMNIRVALSSREQASIAGMLALYPAAQGLGTVVGYLALGVRHGVAGGGFERVSWRGLDDEPRAAKIPAYHFLRERLHEFV